MKDFNEIDNLTKDRKEIEKVRESKILAIGELNKALKDFDEAKARLAKLVREKEQFLLKRDAEALERLAEIQNAIIDAQNKVTDITRELDAWIGKTSILAEKIISKAFEILEKAQRMFDSACSLEKMWNTALEKIEIQSKQAEELLVKNVELGKALDKREKEVEEEKKVAEEKLSRAEDLVFWHKNKKGEKITR